MRDCQVTWSANLYLIRPGSQVYDSLLEEFPESHGDMVGDEHNFSSSDEWSIREDDPDVRGHATGMCPRSQG